MTKLKIIFTGLFAGLLPVFGETEFNPNGVWQGEKGQIEIFDCGNHKCGKIVTLKEPYDKKGAPKVDVNNPDEKLKTQPILGMQNIKGLQKKGANHWEEGSIYNPEDGGTYASEMTMTEANVLKLRGYWGPFFKTQTWKRAK